MKVFFFNLKHWLGCTTYGSGCENLKSYYKNKQAYSSVLTVKMSV